ncbi:MAG: hypothetical protein WCW66_02995 [Patescibacteria group bacterium]
MNNQKGIVPVVIVAIIAGVVIIGGGVIWYFTSQNSTNSNTNTKNTIENTNSVMNTNTNSALNTNSKVNTNSTINTNNNTIQNTNNVTNTNTTVTINTNSALDETADWETYTNTRYAYTIKYPDNWYVDTNYSEADFTYRAGEQTYIGGDTSWSNYSNPSQYTLGTIPNDIESVNLLIWKVSQSSSVDDFINGKFSYYDKESFISNDVTVTRLFLNDENGQESERRMLLLKQDDRLFDFTYGQNGSLSVMEDMINTFQFTN